MKGKRIASNEVALKSKHVSSMEMKQEQFRFFVPPGLSICIENFIDLCNLYFSPENVLLSKKKPLLILGETGVGKSLFIHIYKELFKKANHVSDDKVCIVNCACIPENLIESTLFGYVKGAFTGAVSPAEGIFEKHRGGLVVLDEVGELPESAQAKLLRLIENNELHKVGSNKTEKCYVHILGSSNKDIEGFRKDFWFRFFHFTVPPVRERREDILFYFHQHSPGILSFIEKSRIMQMISYNWPGNVREIENSCMALKWRLMKSDKIFNQIKKELVAESDEIRISEEFLSESNNLLQSFVNKGRDLSGEARILISAFRHYFNLSPDDKQWISPHDKFLRKMVADRLAFGHKSFGGLGGQSFETNANISLGSKLNEFGINVRLLNTLLSGYGLSLTEEFEKSNPESVDIFKNFISQNLDIYREKIPSIENIINLIDSRAETFVEKTNIFLDGHDLVEVSSDIDDVYNVDANSFIVAYVGFRVFCALFFQNDKSDYNILSLCDFSKNIPDVKDGEVMPLVASAEDHVLNDLFNAYSHIPSNINASSLPNDILHFLCSKQSLEKEKKLTLGSSWQQVVSHIASYNQDLTFFKQLSSRDEILVERGAGKSAGVQFDFAGLTEKEVLRSYYSYLLNSCKGNMAMVSRKAGMDRERLRPILKKLGIYPEKSINNNSNLQSL